MHQKLGVARGWNLVDVALFELDAALSLSDLGKHMVRLLPQEVMSNLSAACECCTEMAHALGPRRPAQVATKGRKTGCSLDHLKSFGSDANPLFP